MRRSRMILALTLLISGLGTTGLQADGWPQWLGPTRDAVWHETGIIDRFPEGGLKPAWRVKIGGGYAGPAVADGRVYVTDFVTDADVRAKSDPMARPNLAGKERVLCLDAASGKELWKHEDARTYAISYPAGPRCTPTVAEGKVYTVGAEGDLLCLDAANGSLVWSKNYGKDYQATTPQWGFAGHPLVDGKKLICIVGGEGSVAVAFDKDTGKELWRALSAKEPGYSSPALIEAGGKRQLLIFHAQALNSLDPETGAVYWTVPLVPSYGMAVMTPRRVGDYLFAGGNGTKSVLLKLDPAKPAVTEVWRGTRDTSISPINMTPFLDGEMIYGTDQPGSLCGVELKTGQRLWQTSTPTTGEKPAACGTVFIVRNGERYFLFSETGDLIIARLSPKGYEEVSRMKLLEPTGLAFGRDVVWSHPAFAEKSVFARNDKEIVCVSLQSNARK
jgi:outer membrane protein assembly factor BamB